MILNGPFIKDFCRNQRWPARTRARVLRPPDWLCYAAAVLKKESLSVSLYDFVARGWDKDRLAEIARREKPDFVVIDSSTPSIYSDIECAWICKSNSRAKVIMVGTHATAFPRETLMAAKGSIDVIALGEYDHTISDIIRSWPRLEGVRGVAYLRQGKTEFGACRPLIDDLDSLPFPAWHYLDIYSYFDAGRLYPYINIIGGRGCPYQCSFCQWPQLMFGHQYRFRSPKNIVDEIEYDLSLFPGLKKGEFFFEDDTFTVNKERAELITEEISRRGLGITWSANSRPDILDPGLFRKMKLSGCRELLVGFESGDQHILDNIKKNLKLEHSWEFVRLAREAGLQVHGCFVLGLPGETKESAARTIEFALKLGIDTLQFSAAVPLPGSEYFDYCQKQGLLKASSWDNWLEGGEQGAVVEYPGLSIKDINRMVDDGLKRFYLNPRFILKSLASSRGLRDVFCKARGGFNFLSYLLNRS